MYKIKNNDEVIFKSSDKARVREWVWNKTDLFSDLDIAWPGEDGCPIDAGCVYIWDNELCDYVIYDLVYE